MTKFHTRANSCETTRTSQFSGKKNLSNQVFYKKSFRQHNFQSDHEGIWDREKTLIEHA